MAIDLVIIGLWDLPLEILVILVSVPAISIFLATIIETFGEVDIADN